MPPPASLVDLGHEPEHDIVRPTKKARVVEEPEESVSTTLRHPLGVRPSGNAYLAPRNAKKAAGGFAILPDELIAILLESLDAPSLLRLGGACRALHAFTRNEELWRALFTESSPQSFTWRGTWRSTFLDQDRAREPTVDCNDLFSDVLHRPFYCTHIDLEPYVSNIPSRNQILRLEDCTSDTIFEADRPVILTAPTRRWPVHTKWSIPFLLSQYPDVKFRAEAVDWPLATYISYLRANSDESPLYLFDRAFATKMSLSIPDSTVSHLYDLPQPPPDLPPASYWPPACFGSDQDLFSVLGPHRPDHRWLIIGPARSGSTFHKDPNGTSAWNAVLKGRKYWIMFPSSSSLPPPPGVFVSEDQSEVTSPLSIAEWLLTFHAEARATPGCKEGICGEGELLYVPAGWYHLVLNLDESIALTQNFVPRHGLADVLGFLRDKPDQVTGFRDVVDPYALFVEKLREREPELLVEAMAKLDKRESRKGKWEEIRAVDEEGEGGGFSFGFGGDDDEEIP
ncbi:hypothetical protein KVT40_006613 [Elsinoe batatas]|uniref:Uncharacterized protein n=1 Tax=Elsinoe batatas TaxID=2601811 RepID=A0A8K0KWY9_9PEZI|nr:hypothetical protein KVT40_006613 [Elsinoe batatas]